MWYTCIVMDQTRCSVNTFANLVNSFANEDFVNTLPHERFHPKMAQGKQLVAGCVYVSRLGVSNVDERFVSFITTMKRSWFSVDYLFIDMATGLPFTVSTYPNATLPFITVFDDDIKNGAV